MVETRKGNPCKFGHDGIRFVTSRGCVACDRERSAAMRAEALIGGNKTKIGQPCPKGHGGLRYTKSGRCVACAKENVATQRAKNPEAVRAMNIRWRSNNVEALAKTKARYARNNPEKIRSANRNAKARRRAVEGFHTAADIDNIRKLQGDRCFYCCDELNGAGHTEHFISLKKGGSNWPKNLCLSCADCNLSKGIKDPLAWIAEQELVGIVVEVCGEIIQPLYSKVTAHDNRC